MLWIPGVKREHRIALASAAAAVALAGCAAAPRADLPLPPAARAAVVIVEAGQGRGAGLVLNRDGEIVTNAHVVTGSLRARVRRDDGELAGVDVVGRDARLGVALLRLEQDRLLAPAAHGRAARLRPGDALRWVADPADPASDGAGQVVAVQRNSGRRGDGLSFIEIRPRDAAAPAHGVVFDAQGRAIGLLAAVRGSGGSRLLYAIPVDALVEGAEHLRTAGRATRGQIGIEVQPVSPRLAATLGFNRARGALVAAVAADGPAARAGVRRGDIVLEFGGRRVERAQDLPDMIAAAVPGQPVAIWLWRGDGTQQLMITPEEQDTRRP
ncbi:MAG TPA: trypsin-like peptidase domain-containing protein [Acidiferrobacterales bacterium]